MSSAVDLERPGGAPSVLRAVLGVLSVVVFAGSTAAGAPGEEPTAAEPVTAIVGGLVLPVAGPPVLRGTVIVRGAKIEAVGAELPVPDGAIVVDATGKHVAPGFVAVSASGIGIESGQGKVSSRLDPYALDLRLALAAGITTANVEAGSGGSFFFRGGPDGAPQGASAVVKLTHGDLKAMLVKEPGLNSLSLPSRQVELNLFNLREGFRKAAEHLKKVEEAEKAKKEAPKLPPEIARYVTVLKNERPTVVSARTPEEIRDILRLQGEFPFDLVISRPERGYPLARELAAKGVPVLLKARGEEFDFDLSSPVVDEDGLVPVRRPAAFAEAGVEVSIITGQTGVSLMGLAGRDILALPLEAAYAVRGGMSEAQALEAITINPARILGIDDRVGTLEPGKDADILILSRHPLDYRSYVLKAYVNGKLYYEREKSRLYRDVPLQ
jgi:imidazolonepropionase-like amidohydrolase